MNQNNVVISFIGNISQLNTNLQQILNNAVEKTKNNTGVHLQIAFNYGARAEIVNAINKIIDAKETNITEDIFEKYLYTKNIPDPKILIRTGGEMRISNYLLWQIAYSELIIIPDYWPDFNQESLINCIKEFASRSRRFGK